MWRAAITEVGKYSAVQTRTLEGHDFGNAGKSSIGAMT
jgi:hypothetical protein